MHFIHAAIRMIAEGAVWTYMRGWRIGTTSHLNQIKYGTKNMSTGAIFIMSRPISSQYALISASALCLICVQYLV